MNTFLYAALVPLMLVSCKGKPSTNRVNQSTIQSFRISIANNGFIEAESPEVILTEKNIKVVKGTGADSLQFITPVGYSDTLSRISEISPLSLEENYSNDCIADGLQLTIVLTKGDTTQTVRINNFYQPDIGVAIDYLNAHVPEKYRILYDRKQLEEEYEKCKEKNNKPAQ